MPQFQNVCTGNKLSKLGDVVAVEVPVVVGGINAVTYLVRREVCQQTAEHLESPVGIAHVAHRKNFFL